MKKILIDTDVILDFFFDRKPYSDYASRIFSLCEKGKLKAHITPVIISNTYYLLRRTATHKKVLEKIRLLLTITDILLIDKDVVLQALNSEFKDFEDALQNFACIKNGKIDVILTQNIKDYSKSKISVQTPENFIKAKMNY
ncbi:MAG: PIN domain-containing protein [Ignavibacteriae bacterium]|nr:PIN domain-containing protein [Ignavibacteriota bacterium]